MKISEYLIPKFYIILEYLEFYVILEYLEF